MYILTKKYTRPTNMVPFYFEVITPNPELRDYISTHHPDAILKMDKSLSDDKLTLTVSTYWKNRTSLLRYITDSYCYTTTVVPLIEHNDKHGIVNISTTTEIRS